MNVFNGRACDALHVERAQPFWIGVPVVLAQLEAHHFTDRGEYRLRCLLAAGQGANVSVLNRLDFLHLRRLRSDECSQFLLHLCHSRGGLSVWTEA